MRHRSCEHLVEYYTDAQHTLFLLYFHFRCRLFYLGQSWLQLLCCPVVIISSRSFTLNSVLVEMINYMVTLLTNLEMPPNLLPNGTDLIFAKMTTGTHNPKLDNSRWGAERWSHCSLRAGSSCKLQGPLHHLGMTVHPRAKPKCLQPVSSIWRLGFPKWDGVVAFWL